MTDLEIIDYIANIVTFSHDVYAPSVKGDAKIALDALRHLGFVDRATFIEYCGIVVAQKELIARLEANSREAEERHEAERNTWPSSPLSN